MKWPSPGIVARLVGSGAICERSEDPTSVLRSAGRGATKTRPCATWRHTGGGNRAVPTRLAGHVVQPRGVAWRRGTSSTPGRPARPSTGLAWPSRPFEDRNTRGRGPADERTGTSLRGGGGGRREAGGERGEAGGGGGGGRGV